MRPPAADGMFERLVIEGDNNGYVETDPSRRYGRFDQVLGKGAMKTVYRAFDEVNGIEVAWNQAKICDVMRSPEALQRMYSEVHLLSSLRHRSLISFHASWVDPANRTFNFITEMFTSGTLREYRQKYRHVDVRAVKSWARQILEGLVYLHSRDPPVVHRDLKCDNIFVNGHLGQVKIGDLGLAAMLRGAQSAHSVIGTPEFMAPEVYEEEYNELVDIYSFGMCLLEMLTSEYPYSECSNPAQIYKKVTSGKLPDAFQRIRDPRAKRFIGRCLEKVSERSSAKELLLDPFLAPHQDRPCPTTLLSLKSGPAFDDHDQDVIDGNVIVSAAGGVVRLQHPPLRSLQVPYADDDDDDPETDPAATASTEMTITGKMNPEDDNTIFLKVQIADREGKTSNVYFPFDIVGDTPIDVANEMVKELDIRDLEAPEIAEMIAQEVSSLVPGWELDSHSCAHHAYDYVEDEQDRSNHPFCCLPSPTSSSSSSCHDGSAPLFRAGMTSSRGQGIPYNPVPQWLGDGLFQDDDDISTVRSNKYSAVNYASESEQEMDASFHGEKELAALLPPTNNESARICTGDEGNTIADELRRKCSIETVEPPRGNKNAVDHRHQRRRLMRNQSMMDLRSQLLHRALVEELNKRMFKTIGAVENIGFKVPCTSTSRENSYSRKKKQGSARAIRG